MKILSSLNGGAYGFNKISLSLLYPNTGLINKLFKLLLFNEVSVFITLNDPLNYILLFPLLIINI